MTALATQERPAPEKLRVRPGDSELTLQQILGLSLFKDLTRRAETRLRGPSGQGAVVLRRYRAGEVICRESEPGWTAFYLLKTDDLIWLRESQYAAADASDEVLAIRVPEALSLTVEERLLRAEDSVEMELGEAELTSLLRASAWRPAPGELKALRSEREILNRGDQAERELEQTHAGLLALDPSAKRQRAEELELKDPALAAKLRLLADCAERRMRAQVSLRRKKSDAAPPQQPGSLVRLGARLFGGSATKDAKRAGAPQDGSAAAQQEERPVATLCEGELFGELSCLHRAPRSATVRAIRDCYVLEFLNIVLELLLTSERFRADLGEVYRNRVLSHQLRALPLFASAPSDVIEQLRRRAQLITKLPGEVVFEEGAPADSFYLVRAGTVKVYNRAGRVLGYRSRGELVGERDMISGLPRRSACAAYEHPLGVGDSRGREVAALNVELVRIDRALFEEVCQGSPAFREEVERLTQDGVGEKTGTHAPVAQHTSRFGDLGLNQGRQVMLVQLDRCTSCNDCVNACADVHKDGLPRLALQGPRFGKYLVATSCRKCSDPVCLVGCPVGSIHQGSSGQIIIEDWCISCGLCVAQCPYDAIDLNVDSRAGALVCDQCATLPGGPQCVQACPHDAAQRVDANAFFARTRVA